MTTTEHPLRHICPQCKKETIPDTFWSDGTIACAACENDKPDYFYMIDGHSMMYRAMYAQGPPLTSPDGEPTKGTYIFCKMLMKLLREKEPNFLAMAVDGPRTALHRRKWYPAYKEGRGEVPEEVLIQVKRIKEIVKLLGIPVLAAEGYEADDIIATLVDSCVSAETHGVIVSRDKDLHQLVSRRVRCYDPMDETFYGPEEVKQKWGVFPDQVVEIQNLMGDSTDNVPGVDGIGDVRARELINKYYTVEGVMQNIAKLKPGIQAALQACDLRLTRKLVALDRNVPLDLDPSTLEFKGLDLERAKVVFRQLGFKRWSE